EVETVSPAGVRAADPDEPAKPSPEVSAIAGTPTASTRPSATKARATNRVRVVIGGDDGDGFGRPPLEEELRRAHPIPEGARAQEGVRRVAEATPSGAAAVRGFAIGGVVGSEDHGKNRCVVLLAAPSLDGDGEPRSGGLGHGELDV